MPTPPKKSGRVRRFFAWSFSRFQDYRECPAKAAYKHVDRLDAQSYNDAEVDRLVELRTKGKLKELPATTETFVKGNVVHALAEQFTKKHLKGLPRELHTFKKEFADLLKYRVIEEKQWAFREDWTPTEWFSREAWLRVIVDAHYERARGLFHVIDYKTGKAPSTPNAKSPTWNNEKYFQHKEQREIYAIAIFVMYPDCEKVNAAHWYLDAGVEYNETFTRAVDFEKLKTKWAKLVKPMFNDRSFVPRPSIGACKFCPFKKSEGGPCKF